MVRSRPQFSKAAAGRWPVWQKLQNFRAFDKELKNFFRMSSGTRYTQSSWMQWKVLTREKSNCLQKVPSQVICRIVARIAIMWHTLNEFGKYTFPRDVSALTHQCLASHMVHGTLFFSIRFVWKKVWHYWVNEKSGNVSYAPCAVLCKRDVG